ncbi:MAG: EAL domain-containing protein [Solobacterium sp.]|nr:EAL domain-containing protein [Solobacterium sp.]
MTLFRAYFKKILLASGLTALMLSVFSPLVLRAQEPGSKVVRVGWYESAFHRTDQFGRKSGYGYEYQRRIAVFTGWTYEYVEGSWSELFEKLVAGEIDLLSDVSYTPERAEKILYSAEGMGTEDYLAFISPDNTEIRPDDFSTFNGKRVGVNKNSIQEQMFIAWADAHRVTPQITELSGKTPELLEMLDHGEIDVLVTLDTYGNSADVVPVCKIGSSDFYFGINKNRPDLKRELDTAMNRILDNNREFNQQMTEKFNRAGAVNSFLSAEEKTWLKEHGVIRVGYRKNFLPFCDMDAVTGELTGALSEFLSFAKTCQKNAELSFETHGYDTTEDVLRALSRGEIDCVFPVNLSAYDGEQLGIIITDPFVSTQMYAAVRTADHKGVSPETQMTAAVLKGHPNHETFLKDNFPDWDIRYYDSSKETFRAVHDGEADCTLVSSYRINRVRDLFDKNNLSALATGATMDLCFAMNRSDDCLYSILTKIINLYPNPSLNTALTSYSFEDERVTFSEYIRDNLPYAVAAAAVFTVVILLLVLRSMKAEEKANEGRRLISETERDPLTGLYNWNFFLAYAGRIYREHPEKHMDAIVVNIDRFHSVNALNGREFGDRVLKTMGEEITRFLSETEGIACRYEADRFDLYCLERKDWQPLLDRLQKSVDGISGNASVRLRMGVKPWQAGMEPILQFDCARTACGKMRGEFKSQVMIYDSRMGHQEEIDQRLLNDLRNALAEKQFHVWYQPKYRIQCEPPELSSAEALVRWIHPELGTISPGEFIPLLEKDGQISLLDHYVWEEAVKQIAAWRDRFGYVLPVSVNLSRVDVFDPGLIETLDSLVKKYGLKSSDLKLEVTESAYTEDAGYLIRVIEQLRLRGYEIEMDDFGSGYSSLNMLSSMPVDILKMDMAFVRNIERNDHDFRLVELIIDIADYLKVPVIAEGVETENQLNLLRDAGCDIVQGYYFSKPLPAEEFETKILRREIQALNDRRDCHDQRTEEQRNLA